MKLQLIYDLNYASDDDWGDSKDEEIGYASNVYTNDKLPHETVSFHDAMYKRMEKYFSGNGRFDSLTLVEIPDDITFQYMVEGAFDYDYVAYNLHDYKICISNNTYMSTKYGRNDSYAYASSTRLASSLDDNNMFSFGTSNDSKFDEELDSRPKYSIVPEKENYSNIEEVLRPFIVYKFAEWFKRGASIIYDTQSIYNTSRYGGEVAEDTRIVGKGSIIKYLPGERGCDRTFNMRYEQFIHCFGFWMSDHPIFNEARQFISDNEIEAYKSLRNLIHAEISETK